MITTADRTALPAAILDNYLACIFAKQRAYESEDAGQIDAARRAFDAARDDALEVLCAASMTPVVHRGMVWALGPGNRLMKTAYTTPDHIRMEG